MNCGGSLMKRISIAFVLILGLTSAQSAAPRTVVVSALGDGSKQTSAVHVLRYATNKEEALVRVGDRFEAGDELTAITDITIELTCPEGSAVKFSGKFRAFISAPKDKQQDCAINLLAGQADIITNHPTSIESGERIAGSKGTVYSIRVDRDVTGSTLLCAVLDGEVEVRGQSGDPSQLKGGSKKVWSPASTKEQVLTADDIKGSSALYARMDAVKAKMAGAKTTQSTVAELETLYRRVFQAPSDAVARVELAAKLTNLKITSGALYQLDRAEKLTPSTDRAQLAIVAAVRSVAYQQSGDSAKAAEEAAKAQRIDPNVFKSRDIQLPK